MIDIAMTIELAGLVITIGTIIFYGGQIVNRVKTVEKDIDEVKTSLRSISEDINSHTTKITVLETQYGESNSPTVPNPKGRRLLEESGFDSLYPSLKPKLFGLMDKMNLRTLYDYEKGAEKALKELKNDPIIDPLKNYAVNNPQEPLELIFTVAAWVIRDDYEETKKIASRR